MVIRDLFAKLDRVPPSLRGGTGSPVYAKQTPQLLSQGYIQYVKVFRQTNHLMFSSVYDSRVASRYWTDNRLVSN